MSASCYGNLRAEMIRSRRIVNVCVACTGRWSGRRLFEWGHWRSWTQSVERAYYALLCFEVVVGSCRKSEFGELWSKAPKLRQSRRRGFNNFVQMRARLSEGGCRQARRQRRSSCSISRWGRVGTQGENISYDAPEARKAAHCT